MQLWYISVMLFVFVESFNTMQTKQCPNKKTTLGNIRKRRHLTFPDKSNFVITMSLLKAFMTHAPAGWNLALEVDVLFPLPDSNFTNSQWRRKLHHRQKRELWERIQNALYIHNVNGRACVMRGVCEAQKLLATPGKSLVHDILRAIFTAPVHENDFQEEMGDAYEELFDSKFCQQTQECPFSILQCILLLNKT